MKYVIHRGITNKYIKENSYCAIKRALMDVNSSGVEFDIRLTKDNVIVLSHDSIDIESSNYSDIIKKKYLSTLDVILGINTKKILLIDIKVRNNYKRFAKRIIKYLDNINNKNIYLASFNKKIIKYLKQKTNYKLGYITFKNTKNNNYFEVINFITLSKNNINKYPNKEIFLWTIHNKREEKLVLDKFSNTNYYLIKDSYSSFTSM